MKIFRTFFGVEYVAQLMKLKRQLLVYFEFVFNQKGIGLNDDFISSWWRF